MPILVFLLIGVAFAGFNYMGSLSTNEKLQNDISQLNTELQGKRDGLTRAQNASAEIPSMKNEIERLSQSLSRSREFMPSENSARDVLAAISKEAKIVGVRVPQSRPAEVIPKNYYDELPIEVELEGSYSQLALLMYQLSKQKLIVHPLDMQIATKQVADGVATLKMSGKIVGFQYKEAKK